ncbi:MAG: hypothetical protein RRY36_05215 [Bacteroidaceae bacterium]
MGLQDLTLPNRDKLSLNSLTETELSFLDYTLFSVMPHFDLHRLMFPLGVTKERQRQRMSALLSGQEGAKYLKERKKQLIKHFIGEPSVIPVDTAIENTKDTLDFGEDDMINAMKIIKRELKLGSADSMNKEVLAKIMSYVMSKIETTSKPESPRMYLAESCTNCRYKVFVGKECEDECTRCNYKKFGEDNGVSWDYKDMLDENKLAR